jgi:hypothetical protein
MLACGTQSPIIGEVEVGVIVQLHLKCRHKNVMNPMPIAQNVNTEICIKVNNSKQKAKTELFLKDFVPDLNTKTWATLPDF